MAASPAKTDEEFRALMETDPEEVKLIRSMEDWQTYASRAGEKDHPCPRFPKTKSKNLRASSFLGTAVLLEPSTQCWLTG
jgi:hypothetical protein